MPPVAVRILHPLAEPGAGPLTRWLAAARAELAERQRRGFEAAGGGDIEVVTGEADGSTEGRPRAGSFGQRLRDLVAGAPPAGGLVVLGSGAIPLATSADRRLLLETAAADASLALANNRYSADVVAIARLDRLPPLPELPGDNALPRWLEAVAGYEVRDLRRRWRLGVDVDGPLDLLLLDSAAASADPAIDLTAVRSSLAAIRRVAADRHAELIVSGRTSAAALAWLERSTAARVRAWVEERGLRASSPLAGTTPSPNADRPTGRPAVSLLGRLLDRDGPSSLADHLASFGEAAIVDSRVLLAHRLGPDEAAWPTPEDRFASDLLQPDAIADPWLRELTRSAANGSIPIILGGHTAVGPGVRLVVGRPARGRPWT